MEQLTREKVVGLARFEADQPCVQRRLATTLRFRRTRHTGREGSDYKNQAVGLRQTAPTVGWESCDPWEKEVELEE